MAGSSKTADVPRKLPPHEQIAGRAYQLYLARGCQPGHAMDDWLQAEYELLQLPIHKIAELDDPKYLSPKSKRLVVKKGALVALVQMALVLATQL